MIVRILQATFVSGIPSDEKRKKHLWDKKFLVHKLIHINNTKIGQ